MRGEGVAVMGGEGLMSSASDVSLTRGGGGTSPQSASTPSTTPISTPISTSAKAAADTVIGMIAKAEIFLATNVGSSKTLMSSVFSGGVCSPRNSSDIVCATTTATKMMMEDIPEEPTADEQQQQRQQQGDNYRNTTSRDATDAAKTTATKEGCEQDTNCFEFEEFSFNPFQQDDMVKADKNVKNRSISLSPSILANAQMSPSPAQPSPEQPRSKGYEIRLKSTFSNLRAKKENLLAKEKTKQQTHTEKIENRVDGPSTPPRSRQTVELQNNNNIEDVVVPTGSSRAFPDGLPFKEVLIPKEIVRSVSELTMRSHGAFELHRYTSDTRRMAYYAVGRAVANDNNNNINDKYDNNKQSSGGGNRRCYFTGCAIPYGMPFYAGSVQQGPRTLVVFCLPSALNLPAFTNHHLSSKSERERYLELLPQPDESLLSDMCRRYREPFETLPVQVRSPHCWRLFVKFCFFSGLPIAEGEMHYRVKNSVATFSPTQILLQTAQQQQQEEIALSHEVMEAVNGEESDDMLTLPNRKVFDYLKRQYSQQCSKLNEEVFDRKSWEAVMPEV